MDPIVTASAAASVQARSRIRAQIYQTPLLPSRSSDNLLFKAENFQLTGSFKIRGASAVMSALPADQKLITASSGNHGIGSALAAQRFGRQLTVVLPETVVPQKLEKIRSFGVEIIIHGADAGVAEQHAQEIARTTGAYYISPYNDEEVIAGQGTIGLELLDQAEKIDNVYIAMGGGGLISGIGAVLKAFSPNTRIIGAAAEASMALALSIQEGQVVECEHLDTLADGVAGGLDEDTLTLPLATAILDEIVACSEEEIEDALRILAREENLLVEGSAALAYAAYLRRVEAFPGENHVIILCGANFDPAKIHAIALS